MTSIVNTYNTSNTNPTAFYRNEVPSVQTTACDILIATVRIDTGNYCKMYRRRYHVPRTCKFHLTPQNRANGTVNSNSSHGMVSLAELHTWPHNWKGPSCLLPGQPGCKSDANNLWNNWLSGVSLLTEVATGKWRCIEHISKGRLQILLDC